MREKEQNRQNEKEKNRKKRKKNKGTYKLSLYSYNLFSFYSLPYQGGPPQTTNLTHKAKKLFQ